MDAGEGKACLDYILKKKAVEASCFLQMTSLVLELVSQDKGRRNARWEHLLFFHEASGWIPWALW